MKQKQAYQYDANDSALAFLYAILFFVLISLVISFIPFRLTFWVKLFINFIAELVFLAAFWVLNQKKKENISEVFCMKRRVTPWAYLLGAFIAAGLVFSCISFTNVFVEVLQKIGFKLPDASTEIEIAKLGHMFAGIFFIALVPAILEELVFRKVVYEGLRERSEMQAVLLSSLCFALMHGTVFMTVYQFILGAALATAFAITHDIKLSMFMHFMNNAIVIVMMYISYGKTAATVSLAAWPVIASVLLLLAGIAAAAVLFWLMYKLNHKHAKALGEGNILKQKAKKPFPVTLLLAILISLALWIVQSV